MIPEEPGTEVDESLSKLMSSLSTNSASLVQTPFPGAPTHVHSDPNSGELVRFSPTETTSGHTSPTSSLKTTIAVTATSSTATVTSAIKTSASLSPSFFIDPFSAAPFNPATIQQHQFGIHPSADLGPSNEVTKQVPVRTVVSSHVLFLSLLFYIFRLAI